MDNLNLANTILLDITVPFNHGFGDDVEKNIDDKFVLTCEQLKALNNPILIDLRDQDAVNKDGVISRSILIPLRELEDSSHVLNSEKEMFFLCSWRALGIRSRISD